MESKESSNVQHDKKKSKKNKSKNKRIKNKKVISPINDLPNTIIENQAIPIKEEEKFIPNENEIKNEESKNTIKEDLKEKFNENLSHKTHMSNENDDLSLKIENNQELKLENENKDKDKDKNKENIDTTFKKDLNQNENEIENENINININQEKNKDNLEIKEEEKIDKSDKHLNLILKELKEELKIEEVKLNNWDKEISKEIINEIPLDDTQYKSQINQSKNTETKENSEKIINSVQDNFSKQEIQYQENTEKSKKIIYDIESNNKNSNEKVFLEKNVKDDHHGTNENVLIPFSEQKITEENLQKYEIIQKENKSESENSQIPILKSQENANEETSFNTKNNDIIKADTRNVEKIYLNPLKDNIEKNKSDLINKFENKELNQNIGNQIVKEDELRIALPKIVINSIENTNTIFESKEQIGVEINIKTKLNNSIKEKMDWVEKSNNNKTEEQFLNSGKRTTKFDLIKYSSEHLLRPEFIYGSPSQSKNKKLWDLMGSYLDSSIRGIQKSIINHVEYTLALTRFKFNQNGAYRATAYSVRDRLLESWNDTNQYFYETDPKRIYYLSMEYLLGRQLKNSLNCLGIRQNYEEALKELGFDLNELFEEEIDSSFGNGGLGRLAACFLDSLASLEYPCWGYGLRFNYGIFRQDIKNGCQVEVPDFWQLRGNPWEIERTDIQVKVFFSGITKRFKDNDNIERTKWEPSEQVLAIAYDNPIPGYDTFNTNNLRLWRACPIFESHDQLLSNNQNPKFFEERQKSEEITSVLYPNDSLTYEKELRLRQQYFFVAATMHDIVRRFFKKKDHTWAIFSQKVAIQLNDTHPSLAIIELLRLLLDEYRLSYIESWEIIYKTFAYTNHSNLPEALETWSVDLFQKVLPRHLEIIYLVNHLFLCEVRKVFPNDDKIVEKLSFIEEGSIKKIRMSHICIVCCHSINGVAKLHSKLLKEHIFKDFYEFYLKYRDGKYSSKFTNVTNGASPRRFLVGCNPRLSEIISEKLGHFQWIKALDLLEELRIHATDKDFQSKLLEVKRYNKSIVQKWVKNNCKIDITIDALYDVQVKRVHEYKRQLLDAFYVIHRYLCIKETPISERSNIVKRVIFFGGKAAPGYKQAKAIIRLINIISCVVNSDVEIGDILKVVFLPNYSVTIAEMIIPATDLSQQISTAGTEASGTGNMKFAMNGALIIGTMDGANIEIAEKISKENMFIFGATESQIKEFRKQMTQGKRDYIPQRLKYIIGEIIKGRFGDFPEINQTLENILNGKDEYCLSWDWESYLDAQKRVDELYLIPSKWLEKSIRTISNMGEFSSDRSILEYAEKIWEVKPVPIPNPALDPNSKFCSVEEEPKNYEKFFNLHIHD